MDAFSAVLLLLVGVFFSGASSAEVSNRSRGGGLLGSNDWDYLLFVQRWPASVCVDGHVTKSVSCAIPSSLSATDWVLHGLWPTKYGTTGPGECNKKAAFSLDPLKPIVSDLKSFWPNLETATPYDSFWKHEWLKHGTCAQNLPALLGEFKFFNQVLLLRKQFNLYQALLKQKIDPSSTRTYLHDQIGEALQKAFGKRIEVYCASGSNTKVHYVAEVRLCLAKDFRLMDCPSTPAAVASETHSCPKNAQLFYPPILSGRPQRNIKHR